MAALVDVNMPLKPPVTPAYLPPFQGPQPFGYTPTAGKAPTPTPMAGFTAPDPNNFTADPSYQWRLSQGTKALERGAAARGTLLTGGTAKALQDYGQGAASQEYGNAYNRALSAYDTNRATNAQNFGQGMSQFQGNLAGDQFGLNAATSTYDRNYDASRTGYEDDAANIFRQNDALNTNNTNTANSYQAKMAEYEQQVAQQRAQQAAIDAARPLAAVPQRQPAFVPYGRSRG